MRSNVGHPDVRWSLIDVLFPTADLSSWLEIKCYELVGWLVPMHYGVYAKLHRVLLPWTLSTDFQVSSRVLWRASRTCSSIRPSIATFAALSDSSAAVWIAFEHEMKCKISAIQGGGWRYGLRWIPVRIVDCTIWLDRRGRRQWVRRATLPGRFQTCDPRWWASRQSSCPGNIYCFLIVVDLNWMNEWMNDGR